MQTRPTVFRVSARWGSRAALAAAFFVGVGTAVAAPAAPQGAHPRLFLDTATVTKLKLEAQRAGSGTARAITKCDDVIAHPASWTSGGYQGMGFVEALSACLVAYAVRGDAPSAQAGVTYFKALLDDYRTLGDGAGGDGVVQHDTGYAMRSFASYAAIAYDWLHDAPGVDEPLRARARARFAVWAQWYDTMGYHRTEPGSNYHAGYTFAESMMSIAEGGEAGAAGDAMWTHVVDDIFATDMAKALAPGGVLDGGDWLEGWQYAQLSISEYAMAARALRDHGAAVTGMAAWEAAIPTRTEYAMVPDRSGAYIGGDADVGVPHAPVNALTTYATLMDAAPDAARGWASGLVTDLHLKDDQFPLIAALAEARLTTPAPFPADASTWYYARGSRELYARTDWSAKAVWMVTQCAPRRIEDHMFNDAGNVVLTRGSDNLIVDPSPYGGFSTLTGNGPTVASPQLPPEYQPGQAWWGTDATVDFRWARQTQSGVVAARCDYAGQYRFQDTASDIASARRDLVLVPYGDGDAALVLIDDIDGAATDRPMLLRLRSLGMFGGGGGAWRATVGASDVVVQVPMVTAGAPTMATPPVGDCSSAPRGSCTAARFAVGEWALAVPAAHAQAITVVDAVGKGVDPGSAASTHGAGWRAVELDRGAGHAAIVVVDPGLTTVTYTAAPGIHVVVGAPAGGSGRAEVTATASGGGCAVTIAARASDGGFDARPVVMKVAADCTLVEDPAQQGFSPPSATDPPAGTSMGGGCCQAGRGGSDAVVPLAMIGLMLAGRRRRRTVA
jgi:hypothetical protein